MLKEKKATHTHTHKQEAYKGVMGFPDEEEEQKRKKKSVIDERTRNGEYYMGQK
jgi:glycerol-3-phosphate cytidylyltransferase-like family protein